MHRSGFMIDHMKYLLRIFVSKYPIESYPTLMRFLLQDVSSGNAITRYTPLGGTFFCCNEPTCTGIMSGVPVL